MATEQQVRPRLELEDTAAAWGLQECVAWIIFRDLLIVRQTCPDTPPSTTPYMAVVGIDEKGNEVLRERAGEPSWTLLRMDMEACARAAARGESDYRTPPECLNELYEALRAGKISARGTDLQGTRKEILSDDWRGLTWTTTHCQTRTEPCRSDDWPAFEPIWLDVVIPRGQIVALWAANTHPPDTVYFTGAAGRPSSMRFVKEEHQRRIAAREHFEGVGQEARWLSDWLSRQHPEAPPLTDKAIRNNIADAHRARPKLSAEG